MSYLEGELASGSPDHLPLVALGVVRQPAAVGDTLDHLEASTSLKHHRVTGIRERGARKMNHSTLWKGPLLTTSIHKKIYSELAQTPF